jgi:hypothetical protein
VKSAGGGDRWRHRSCTAKVSPTAIAANIRIGHFHISPPRSVVQYHRNTDNHQFAPRNNR